MSAARPATPSSPGPGSRIPGLVGAVFAVLLLAVTTAAPAAAQTGDEPPYEKELLRLAEILGALHYLRPLCGEADGQTWRAKMSELMDAEGGAEPQRERLAGAFNAGYRGFQRSYRSCTPSAQIAADRYLEEGARLSQGIAKRHGS
jgi:uncharacterized protein (TIGR02301 family)